MIRTTAPTPGTLSRMHSCAVRSGSAAIPLVEQRVGRLHLALEPAEVGLDAARERAHGGGEPFLLHDDHREELPAPRHQVGHRLLLVGAGGAGRGLERLGVVGEHAGIERVGLGEDAQCAGEVAHRARVHDNDGQARVRERPRDGALVAAGGLEDDASRGECPQRVGEHRDPGGCVGNLLAVSAVVGGGVELVLGDVDADRGARGLHGRVVLAAGTRTYGAGSWPE